MGRLPIFCLIIRLMAVVSIVPTPMLSGLLSETSISKSLSGISTVEHNDLEQLFSKLFLNDHFAYTLLGGKAVSLTAVLHEVELDDLLSGSRKGRLFWNKWDTWAKYQTLFPMPNFLLFRENSNVVEDTSWIILINKQVFKETVNNHLAVFQEELGNVSSEELLKDLETGKSSFQDLVHGNDLLLGILLGYGEHNCRIFEQRKKSERTKSGCSCILNKQFSSKESSCNRSFQQINHQSYILKVNPVCFCADVNHCGTKPLAEKYLKLNEDISKLYKDKDVLETTLSMLMRKITIEPPSSGLQ